MREVYDGLIRDPARIEKTLKMGAAKARAIATPFTQRLRHAVGLRALDTQADTSTPKAAKAALPVFKQYREKDGLFYFKLTDARGALLLQSTGFAAPREAAQAMARLQAEGKLALDALAPQLIAPDDVERVTSALDVLRQSAA